MATEHMPDTNSKKIYELGYLFIPVIAENNLAAEVETIKGLLKKAEVEIVSEDFPKLIPLAYPMTHGGSGKKEKFDKAYFGWIKFQGQATAAEFIKRACDAYEHFLRFLIIKTVKDESQSAPRTNLRTVAAANPIARMDHSVEASGDAAKQYVDEDELEKTLESIVV